jgi:RimJ/RimL family protein N-acetyltransferase
VLALPIETPRLIIRPLRETDEEALLAYQSNADVVRYLPWPQRDRAAVREALAVAVTRDHFVHEGDYLAVAIELKNSGDVIGQLNAMYRSEVHQHAEVGYVLNPAFGGVGLASEATTALVDALFATGTFHRLSMRIDARNARSLALATRIGFRNEGCQREVEISKGERVDICTYAVLHSEWHERRTAQ